MRKVLLVLLLFVMGCSEFQVNWHLGFLTKIAQTEDPVEKQILQTEYDTMVAAYEAFVADITEGEPCPQWFQTAMDAGFTPEEWKEPVARIMQAESNCDPFADSSESTARGLMQILMMWIDDCRITYEQLHDAFLNLLCARHISIVGGWDDWVTWR